MTSSSGDTGRNRQPTCGTGGSELRHISPDEWQAYVVGNGESTPFHHQNWLRLFNKTYGMPIRIVALTSGDRIHAGMPFVEAKLPFCAARLLGLPFTDCVRPLSGSTDHLTEFVRRLPAFLGQQYGTVVLQTDCPLWNSVDNQLVRHELKIGGTFDSLVERFDSSLRRNVRRAERNGLTFRVERDDATLASFYRLHVATRRKQGVPVQPRSFFANLYELLIRSKLGEIAVVRWQDQIVAAAVLLQFHATLVYKYGASDPHLLHLRPNDFLFFHMIRHAASIGMRQLDFGTSECAQLGLRRFKAKWGAEEYPMYRDYVLGRPVAHRKGTGPFMRVTKTVIQNSPSVVCRLIGETLYKYSP